MTKKVTKPKRTKLPVLNWRETELTPNGNRQWLTTDGTFKLIQSDNYQGIKLPTRYVLYVSKVDGWHKISEGRGRAAIEKLAREKALAWEEAE